MVRKIRRPKHGPEWYLQRDLVEFLEARGWLVEPMHGNLYQKGIPDLYCFHRRYGERWIDCKIEGQYTFTKAQRQKWPQWEKKGIGIWILTAATQREYDKLFKPPNWRDYWKESWGHLPDIDALLDELDRQGEP
ncbi:MAG: hypothetical protein DWQ31_16835 [Planctomycetota bacterium]|nr:MAG: hypothetical protein DWQ31_16835 [Planctomycetota bacterium]REJ92020.1 MAG: hypothetical protein DWQ35_12785 [Planctomycetota bacterium]REK28556.1 MAG: hypothetical protein DWQ42_04375 [Planctomycetota bacterium]REK39171.1 MAG: hypothetical protein DWQ46_17960 [Planctomycetota bacterium]